MPPRVPWAEVLDPLGAGEGEIRPPADLPYQDLLPETLRDAAVLVPVRPAAGGLELILTRRTEKLRHHAGQISFPGGRVDASDAGRLDAALRETHEEIGLRPEQVEPLGCLAPVMTITGYAMVPFVGLVEPDSAIAASPHEVEEVFTAPLEFMLDEANHERRRRFFNGRMREFFVIQYGDYFVWGATAQVIVDLAARVRRGGIAIAVTG
ncbi:MAG: CoA pyrophosphatase [Pseudomonadota bacterium]